MSRRQFIIFLFLLPLLWAGSLVYAQTEGIWQDPTQNPPAGNLYGPVWAMPTSETLSQDGSIRLKTLATSGVTAGFAQFISDRQIVLYAQSLYPENKWAGYFGSIARDPATLASGATGDGNLFAKRYCLPDGEDAGTDADCITSWANTPGSGTLNDSALWTRETNQNIFKGNASNLSGIVAIGTATPSTVSWPSGTRLGIMGETGSGPRLYIDNNTGNPEINLKLSSTTANDHWAVYADSGSRQLRFWAKESASSSVGRNALALSADGVMIFPGWGNFALLSITKTGSGTITSNDTRINCGLTCSYAYNIITGPPTVTLTAAVAEGVAINWGGACSGTSTTCTLIMNGDKNVTVAFSKPTLAVTVSSGLSTGTVASVPVGATGSCTGSPTYCWEYNLDTIISLTANPVTGYLFTGWGGACSGTGACNVTMSSNKTVTASFAKPILTVAVTGTGSVSSSPSGITACSSSSGICTATFDAFDNVTLAATIPSGQTGVWGGACSVAIATDPCILRMDSSKTATIEFLTPAAPVASTWGWSSALNARGRYVYTLNGSVRANGLSTNVSFRYGSFSATCALLPDVIPLGSVLGGATHITVSGEFEGSSTQEGYYYCLVAQNSSGTHRGSVKITRETSDAGD